MRGFFSAYRNVTNIEKKKMVYKSSVTVTAKGKI